MKDEVKAMLTSVSNYAESVVKKADYTTPKDVKDMNNYHVDITGIDEEVVRSSSKLTLASICGCGCYG